jgi:hypothetical protein
MQLKEVNNETLAREFLLLPVRLYKNDPNWIRPLDKDIEEVFDRKKNKYFRHGEAIRWVLYDDGGKVIGRVAAFINKKTAKTFEQPTGGLGFLECEDNKQAAFILFDTCKQWLTERGMEAMDGPVNFGEKDKWWGLMVDGFSEPTYCMYYHHKYYRAFFEEYGFKTYFEQYNFIMEVTQKLPEKYAEKAARVAQNPGYTCVHIDKKQLPKFAEDFRSVYNSAWTKHHNFKGMSQEQAMAIMKAIKPIMEEELMWFAYFNGQPVAFYIMLPEVNQIFKHLNGKFNTLAKLKFLYLRWRGVCRKMFGVAFGIAPEHQGKGVEGYIITHTARKIQPMGRYDTFEMTWIGDFNPKMVAICEDLGARRYRTYITYRKLFDEGREFKRAPIIH